jgi:hypothetical protein
MLANTLLSLLQHVRRLAAALASDEQLLADFLAGQERCRRAARVDAALINAGNDGFLRQRQRHSPGRHRSANVTVHVTVRGWNHPCWLRDLT